MKKIITISIIALLVFVIPSSALAQRGQQAQGNQPDQGEKQQVGTGNRGIETATTNLSRVSERNNNPEVGEQLRTMVQNHKKVQVRTKTALQQMSQRNRAVKLLVGPDYKNAGQVRSSIVGLRNDIKKLEQIKDKSLPSDIEDIQGAIDELQVEAEEIETQLSEQVSGFSLFGWLAKLLAH